MNRLKQHLNDSLQELEMTPAMQAEIFRKTEKPVRAARKHGRVAIAALLVMCMVGITAVATQIAGWTFDMHREAEDLYVNSFCGTVPTHQPFTEAAMEHFYTLPELREGSPARVGRYTSFEEYEKLVGDRILRAAGMELAEKDVLESWVRIRENGDVLITTHYKLVSADGQGSIMLIARADTSKTPVDSVYESETYQPGHVSSYEIVGLGVTAQMIVSNGIFVDGVFNYEDMSYSFSITPPDTETDPITYACALLETLYN